MIKKKICMLGSFAVGKTSLVQQYVNSIFSEKYHTTIGVKIDQKIIRYNNTDVNLLLWDIHGEDKYQKVKPAYIMGSSGYFVVIDGTRRNTVETALELQKMAAGIAPEAACIFLLNKSDLTDEWELTEEDMTTLKQTGFPVIKTSARLNEGVEEAFLKLTEQIMK